MYSQEDEASESVESSELAKKSESATSENLMDADAYRKMVIEDLNFLVVGENNPKQGLAYTLNTDKTQLDLTGNIKWGKREQPIINLTGSFSTADGVFILDGKDGAKKAKLTVDVFWTTGIGNKSGFWGGNIQKGRNTALTILQKESLDTEYLKQSRSDSLVAFKIIASEFDIPLDKISRSPSDMSKENRIKKLKKNISYQQERSTYITSLVRAILPSYLTGTLKTQFSDSYKDNSTLEKKIINYAPFIDFTTINDADKKEVHILTWDKDKLKEERTIYKDFRTNAFIEAFQKLKKRNQESFLIFEKKKFQIKNADSLWTRKALVYFGTSIFYEREFLNIYKPEDGVTDLSKLFQEERGNLYGLSGSANYYINWRNGAYLHTKGSIGLSRVSNFSEFTLTNFVSTQINVQNEDGTTLEQVTNGTGYLSKGNPYRFTSSKTVAFDFYGGYKTLGVFGRIGLRDDNFANRSTSIPLQAGLVFNFKGKEKDIVSLLLFIDRQNLKSHPNGDTNLGFKVGLPFNLKGKSKG